MTTDVLSVVTEPTDFFDKLVATDLVHILAELEQCLHDLLARVLFCRQLAECGIINLHDDHAPVCGPVTYFFAIVTAALRSRSTPSTPSANVAATNSWCADVDANRRDHRTVRSFGTIWTGLCRCNRGFGHSSSPSESVSAGGSMSTDSHENR